MTHHLSPPAILQLPPSSASSQTSQRLRSIDVFRGVIIISMILVNAQFSAEDSYRQFAHSAWNGWTFADTIFPCFLFLVGVSLTLSTASRLARGHDCSQLFGHALGRAVLLFACGVAIDYLRFPAHEFPFVGVQDHLQLTGALQKIAISYLVAFNIFLWTGIRGVIVGIIGLGLLYFGLIYFYPVPGCGPGSLIVTCNFPGYVDQMLLDGFRWNSTAFDPDGIGSAISTTTSVLFGVLVAQLLLPGKRRPRQRLPWFLGGGLALIAAGELIATWVPINKQLWTTSFAVLMAGIATMALAGCIWLIDDRPLRGWSKPLEILGLNAIAGYLISRLIENLPRVHIFGRSLYSDILAHIASPPIASLLYALVVLAAVSLAIWLMDRRGWHLKF